MSSCRCANQCVCPLYGFREKKLINDQIHGHIELDRTSVQFIDTPQFQRLRDLKQLGSAYFVFPGASHNRFEHCIGVSHLAYQLVKRLRDDQPELDITRSDVKCVRLAGLCHDLGHGPYSHVFDNEFIPTAKKGRKWAHEQASEMMLDYLIDDNGIESVNETEVSFIKALIDGAPRSSTQKEKIFLFDIVANKRNAVDVDKFDYIARDCRNTNVTGNYDTARLMQSARVLDDQICYPQKDAYSLYELFHTRYSLFKRVYTHKTGKAIEYMLTHAMLAADEHLKISDAIDEPERYMLLTDSIVKEIERSTLDELEKSRQIMRRLRKRNLYRMAGCSILLPAELPRLQRGDVNPEVIARHAAKNLSFDPNECLVEWLQLHYGMKDKNPVKNIRFYDKWTNGRSAYSVEKMEASVLIPDHFQETVVRVYSTNPATFEHVNQAFFNWLRSVGIRSEQSSDNPSNTPDYPQSPTITARAQISKITTAPSLFTPAKPDPSLFAITSPVNRNLLTEFTATTTDPTAFPTTSPATAAFPSEPRPSPFATTADQMPPPASTPWRPPLATTATTTPHTPQVAGVVGVGGRIAVVTPSRMVPELSLLPPEDRAAAVRSPATRSVKRSRTYSGSDDMDTL